MNISGGRRDLQLFGKYESHRRVSQYLVTYLFPSKSEYRTRSSTLLMLWGCLWRKRGGSKQLPTTIPPVQMWQQPPMPPRSQVPELPAAPSSCPGTSSHCVVATSSGNTSSHSVRMTRCIFRALCAPQRMLAALHGVGARNAGLLPTPALPWKWPY